MPHVHDRLQPSVTARHRFGLALGRALDRWLVRGYVYGWFRNAMAIGLNERHRAAGTCWASGAHFRESGSTKGNSGDVDMSELMRRHERVGTFVDQSAQAGRPLRDGTALPAVLVGTLREAIEHLDRAFYRASNFPAMEWVYRAERELARSWLTDVEVEELERSAAVGG